MIADFGDMLCHLVEKWSENNKSINKEGKIVKRVPGHILFFRDGVSESQYAQFRASEVAAIRNHLGVMYGKRVYVTAVVCTKRHHTRFHTGNFIPDLGGRAQNQNTKPGKFNQILSERQATA